MLTTRVFRALSVMVVLAAASTDASAIAALKGKLWPIGSTITACFMDPDPVLRANVVEAAKDWTTIANIIIDFDNPPFRTCNPVERTHLRVSFSQSGTWSYIGTDAMILAKSSEPSMNLERGIISLPDAKFLVLKYIGYALGFVSGLAVENSCRQELDLSEFAPAWTREEVERGLFLDYTDVEVAKPPAFVQSSVMHFPFGERQFRGGSSNRCFVRNTIKLTDDDKRFVASIYPSKVTEDPSRIILPSDLSIRSTLNLLYALDGEFPAFAAKGDGVALAALATTDREKIIEERIRDRVASFASIAPAQAILALMANGQRDAALDQLLPNLGDRQPWAYVLKAHFVAGALGEDKQPTEIRRWIRAAADEGDEWGRLVHGLMCEVGYDGAPDLAMAASLYKQVTLPEAMHRLGLLQLMGKGHPRDYVAALASFRGGAAAGYVPSQRMLAYQLDVGLGGPRDRAEAERLIDLAAAKGDAPSQWLRGLARYEASRNPAQSALAIDELQKSSSSGFALATFSLAYLSENGLLRGAKLPDPFTSLYERAAAAGLSVAQYRYAEILLGRIADSETKDKVVALLTAAARGGFKKAPSKLSDLYWLGVRASAPNESTLLLPPDVAMAGAWKMVAYAYSSPGERAQSSRQINAISEGLSIDDWIRANDFALSFVKTQEGKLSSKDTAPSGAQSELPELKLIRQGSGVMVSQDGHILTNHHVVNDCRELRGSVKGEPGRMTARIPFDQGNDVAVVRWSWQPRTWVSLRADDPSTSDVGIAIFGFPDANTTGESIRKKTGDVSALVGWAGNTSIFETNATINPGVSGGPFFDARGQLIGIAVSRPRADSGIQGTYFGIKVNTLRGYLNTHGIKLKPANQPADLSPQELQDLAEKVTVLIQCYR